MNSGDLRRTPFCPKIHPYDPVLLPEPYSEVECDAADEETCRWLIQNRRRPIPLASDQPGTGVTWDIPPLLAQRIRDLPQGRAIDLGCGSGRDAIWLASQGWKVHSVDRHPEAIAKLNALAPIFLDQSCIAEARLETSVVDLRKGTIVGPCTLAITHFIGIPNISQIVYDCLETGGFWSFMGHSSLHYRCFGSPKPVIPTDDRFSIIESRTYWTQDRHVYAAWLQKR